MDKRIKKAHILITNKFKEKILLEDIAKGVGMSKFHLQRLFTAEFNESPAAFLTRIRLECARHFLKLNTPNSMSELATECGFSSLSVFSRAFSRLYGISPTQMLSQFEEKPVTQKLNRELEIVNLPEIRIVYEPTEMYAPDLIDSYQKSMSKIRKLGLKSSFKKIGLMNHLSVHNRDQRLNYLAGIEVIGRIPSEMAEEITLIPSGKYVSFVTQSPRWLFVQELTELKYNWLDHSNYTVRELFAFEEFFGESMDHRTVYIPVMQKKLRDNYR